MNYYFWRQLGLLFHSIFLVVQTIELNYSCYYTPVKKIVSKDNDSGAIAPVRGFAKLNGPDVGAAEQSQRVVEF